MAAKNPRLSIVIEPHIYKLIQRLAKKDETTISKKAKALLMEALDLYEDLGLSTMTEKREQSLKRKTISHEDAW
jgi:histone H3/H4